MVDRQITPGYLKMNIRGTGACDRSASGSGRSMDPLEKQMTSAQDNNKRLRDIYRFPIDRFLRKRSFYLSVSYRFMRGSFVFPMDPWTDLFQKPSDRKHRYLAYAFCGILAWFESSITAFCSVHRASRNEGKK